MNNRRKELLEQFKQMKPEMGIFRIRSKQGGKCYLETSKNLKGKINSTLFQLKAGVHSYQELQREWNEFGEDGFTIEILERLKCGIDEQKTDYSEELAIMKMIWEEKCAQEGLKFYCKK
jgi:hypothetical protein